VRNIEEEKAWREEENNGEEMEESGLSEAMQSWKRQWMAEKKILSENRENEEIQWKKKWIREAKIFNENEENE